MRSTTLASLRTDDDGIRRRHMGHRALVRSFVRGAAAAVSLVVAACHTRPPKFPGLPDLQLPPPRATLKDLPIPPVKLPAPFFPWMAVDAFYPAGANPIRPVGPTTYPTLVDTPGANFPSDDECTSPDGARTLFHLAAEDGGALDYVVLVRDNRAKTQRAVFQIRKALQVLWSPDGTRAAITILTGSNFAEVVILRMDDFGLSETISPDEALRPYFSPYLTDAPRYVMALRWTRNGYLVLRARGEEPNPPGALFGYELLVDTDRLGHPDALKFLRGYRDAPNSRAVGVDR